MFVVEVVAAAVVVVVVRSSNELQSSLLQQLWSFGVESRSAYDSVREHPVVVVVEE